MRDISHSVKNFQFCLVTINNFSGKNQTIEIGNELDENALDNLKLYRLDNTDEMQWKTVTYMDNYMNELAIENGAVTEEEIQTFIYDYGIKYDLISGMGTAVYVVNLDPVNPGNFHTKITVASKAVNLAATLISLVVFASTIVL